MPLCPALPPVIGHRGAARHAPENTLAGFRCARALGCDWVEFDVRLAGDGALILLHDSRLDRTSDGTGRVAALPLAAIRERDAGTWFDTAFHGERVPTLEEALRVAAELGLGANVEIKADFARERTTGARVGAVLAAMPGECRPPLLLSSFSLQALRAAAGAAPEIPRAVLFRAIPRHWAWIAARLGCATVHANHLRLRPDIVRRVRDAGYPLLAYTVNDPARARSLFAWGVTSVFSDAPDIILAALPGGCREGAAAAHDFAATARQGAVH